MSDLNLCQFIGRAGRDAEVRYMGNGDPVATFSIAVGWKTKDKEGTEWVRCNAFGKLAEIVGQYVKKGKQVYVSGRFRTREYEKDGVRHFATEIAVDQLQLLGGREEGGEQPAQRQQTHSERKQARVPQADKPATGFDDMADDIPW
jgi:single-strand DNA-binding protein